MSLYIQLNATLGEQQVTIKRFEELFQLRYIEHSLFADAATEQWIRKRCRGAYKRGSIPSFTVWLGTLYARFLSDPDIPDIAIRWIRGAIGYGIFARSALPAFSYVGEYTGCVRRRTLLFPDLNDYCFVYPRAWKSLKAFTVDSEQMGNFTRYINHSDTPNCESLSVFHDGVFKIIFRTLKEIAPGEELTYHYGDFYWQKRKKQE